MPSRHFIHLSVLVLGLGLLAACDDPEVTAERYYQSALSLLDEGDVDRALIELRNVFDNDGFHREARRLYADLQRDRGDTREAYGQYLRLIEQYPDTVDVRGILAEIALDNGDWEEVVRHGGAAIELAPDLPSNRALDIALAYRTAMLDRNDPDAAAAAERARELLDADPDLIVARRVLLDWMLQGPDRSRALPQVDLALEQQPESRSLHMVRLSILGQQDDQDATRSQLQRMYELFPEDEQITGFLISFYLSSGDFAAAEDFLRQQAGADDAASEGHMAVVQLIGQRTGPDAAIAELNRLAQANEGTDLARRYATESAAIQFRQGDRESAVTQIAQIVESAEGVDLRLDAKMILARMRAAMDRQDDALALVEEILEEDPTYVDALKIRATQKIRDNAFSDAVADLRAAISQNPTDSDALILLADAQQKAGNLALAQQQLAQAVEVSNAAPRPSLIYAQFLASQENLSSAETVLTNSLTANPNNLEVANALGRILLQRDRLTEAAELVQQLQAIDDPKARQMAQALQASILFRQNRVDDSLSFLQSQIGEGGSEGQDIASTLQLLRLQILSNRLEEARDTVSQLAGNFPDSQAVDVLEADMLALEGKPDDAIAAYRSVLEQSPEALPVIERLYRLLAEQGQSEAAAEIARAGLKAVPEARSMQLVEAGRLEREGNMAAAIEIYENMYAGNPEDLVAANNLASLLSVHGQDQADLDRAYQISLRLTGARQPAFQDTLGWIQLQRGDVDAAIQNLQAAARGLPEEPTIAFNLGLAYAEADRLSEARAELERGLELAGDAPVSQIDRAREKLAELDTVAQ